MIPDCYCYWMILGFGCLMNHCCYYLTNLVGYCCCCSLSSVMILDYCLNYSNYCFRATMKMMLTMKMMSYWSNYSGLMNFDSETDYFVDSNYYSANVFRSGIDLRLTTMQTKNCSNCSNLTLTLTPCSSNDGLTLNWFRSNHLTLRFRHNYPPPTHDYSLGFYHPRRFRFRNGTRILCSLLFHLKRNDRICYNHLCRPRSHLYDMWTMSMQCPKPLWVEPVRLLVSVFPVLSYCLLSQQL